jgi:hypothetical protein
LAYYIELHPQGGSVALADGQVIGFSLAHVWGSLGWVGPVAVEPAWQGHGIGHELSRRALRTLRQRNCLTIGLETWPHHLHNIALYLKVGFNPGPLVAVLERDVTGASKPFTGRRLSDVSQPDLLLDDLAGLSSAIVSGTDYRPLMQSTIACGLGDVYVWESESQPEAAAVIHYALRSEAPPPDYANAELLMVRPGKETLLDSLLSEIEGLAASAGRTRVRIAVCSCHVDGLRYLITGCGYRLVKVRLRMYSRQQPVPPERINYLSYAV